jgi:hypothetical protein
MKTTRSFLQNKTVAIAIAYLLVLPLFSLASACLESLPAGHCIMTN